MATYGHFPQGKCGLKFQYVSLCHPQPKSLPSGEVWIEMSITVMLPCTLLSLPSGEVWIEICYQTAGIRPGSRHFPQGKCGLKYQSCLHLLPNYRSLPSGEVWIEIRYGIATDTMGAKSLPSGAVWIEIFSGGNSDYPYNVTSLRGSVD